MDLIREIGPGGSFITAKHTIKRMKTEAVMTKIADRDARTMWEKKGATDTQTRAMKRVREILAKESGAVFSPEVDERIRAKYVGLVEGKLTMPEGW